MARIKRAVAAKKKRRTVMHRAKGYYGAASRTYKHAKEQVQHSLQYQYRDRRNKKREIRSLWITRINAAARRSGRGACRQRHRARPQGPGSDGLRGHRVLQRAGYHRQEGSRGLIDSLESLGGVSRCARRSLFLSEARFTLLKARVDKHLQVTDLYIFLNQRVII